MLRYQLALGLVIAAIYVGALLVGHLWMHNAPSSLDITLAGGIYTIAIAARVTF